MALYMSDANGNLNKVAGNIKEQDTIQVSQVVTQVFEHIYPSGSIYISIDPTSPASLFGGQWTELDSNKTLWITSTSSGNANTSINAGLPNILGRVWGQRLSNGVSTSGAFYNSGATYQNAGGSGSGTHDWHFDASRSNPIYSDSVTTVQPPAYRVYAWRRVS